MPTATATNRKISWFQREDSAGTLDLSPTFQRRPVWRVDQASYLIDTVLCGLPFPEIYLRSSTSADGKTVYEVVDGQQRIRSLLDFARNDYALVGDDVDSRFVGKFFDDLTDGQKRAFWGYDVVTRELHDASDGDIRDLFRRLNISAVNLNDQELRHARYTGQFLHLMERLADDEWWTEMRVVNVRQVRRMEDVEYVSELFVALMAGPQDKKTTIDQYYEDFDADFPDAKKWSQLFQRTRDMIEEVFEPQEIRAWSGKSDFYTLFSVFGTVARKMRRLTAQQQARLRVALMAFRRNVDQAKRKDNKERFADSVHAYADAVARAASDLARRQDRHKVLLELVNKTIAKK